MRKKLTAAISMPTRPFWGLLNSSRNAFMAEKRGTLIPQENITRYVPLNAQIHHCAEKILAEKAYSRNIYAYTPFLGLAEQQAYYAVELRANYPDYIKNKTISTDKQKSAAPPTSAHRAKHVLEGLGLGVGMFIVQQIPLLLMRMDYSAYAMEPDAVLHLR